MRLDARTAALDDATEQRVRLAASLLGAYRLRVRLTPWDGTRCDLLIASTEDAYGVQALALARRRGTAAIAVGRTGDATIGPDATASMLAQHIREQVGSAVSPEAGTVEAAPLPMLCQLAQPPLRGRAVDAVYHGRTLKLRPQTGRAYAPSRSELLAGVAKLPESQCRAVAADAADEGRDMVSASLESVLLHAAHRSGERLPDFPEGRYWLDAWPDLGASPSLAHALRLSLLLIGNMKSIAELVESGLGEATPADLNACLWAFAAADLLRDGESAGRIATPPPRKLRAPAAFLSSLARRFGLRRA